MSAFAAACIRKSNDQRDRTEDVKSVATQRDLVAAFAASRGWTLDDRYVFSDDGITGALFAERPGLQALLAATRTTPVPFSKLIVVEQHAASAGRAQKPWRRPRIRAGGSRCSGSAWSARGPG
jgi:DNA invertase Pin-like site-specific DNA recombinase